VAGLETSGFVRDCVHALARHIEAEFPPKPSISARHSGVGEEVSILETLDVWMPRAAEESALQARVEQGSEEPILVLAASGSGKSSFLASVMRGYREAHAAEEAARAALPWFRRHAGLKGRHTERVCLSTFVGTHSRELPAILRSLWLGLCESIPGVHPPPDVETEEGEAALIEGLTLPFFFDTRSVSFAFPPPLIRSRLAGFSGALELACTSCEVLLAIDSVDSFAEQSYGGVNVNDFGWLPAELPQQLTVIISCVDTNATMLPGLRDRYPTAPVIELEPFSMQRRVAMVRELVGFWGKEFDAQQMAALCSKADASSPLYLTVACRELVLFGSYELISQEVEGYPDRIASRTGKDGGREKGLYEKVPPSLPPGIPLIACWRKPYPSHAI